MRLSLTMSNLIKNFSKRRPLKWVPLRRLLH